MDYLKLLLRWNVLKEVIALIQIVDKAREDDAFSRDEVNAINKQAWVIINKWWGKGRPADG